MSHEPPFQSMAPQLLREAPSRSSQDGTPMLSPQLTREPSAISKHKRYYDASVHGFIRVFPILRSMLQKEKQSGILC
jgi:hypothetical protein